MPDPNDLSGQIQSTAANPASATQDGLSANAQALPDLIETDKYLAGRVATRTPPFGVVFGKLVSPGAQH